MKKEVIILDNKVPPTKEDTFNFENQSLLDISIQLAVVETIEEKVRYSLMVDYYVICLN